MFELSIACKYLSPRRRQLSVSIISLISVIVIALVVWLIVVFFSVTNGLEKNWIQKLIALTAPVRITPTEAYYHSYYYLIDSISDSSGYSKKSIREKKESVVTNPYDPTIDEEVPPSWPSPDLNAQGELKDIVRLAYEAVEEQSVIAPIEPQDFELTSTYIRLHLLRPADTLQNSSFNQVSQSLLAYPVYMSALEKNNQSLAQTFLPINGTDLANLFLLLGMRHPIEDESPYEAPVPIDPSGVQKRMNDFFQFVQVNTLQTTTAGWVIPSSLIPSQGSWKGCAIVKNDQITHFVVAPSFDSSDLQQTLQEQGYQTFPATLLLKGDQYSLLTDQKQWDLPKKVPLLMMGGFSFPAHLISTSLQEARSPQDVRFQVHFQLQGIDIEGEIPYKGVEIEKALVQNKIAEDSSNIIPFWFHSSTNRNNKISHVLPNNEKMGEGIILPRSFRDAGALLGDRGSLTYYSPTTSTWQEQHIPIYVAGFYDPGIIPIGGKFILASPETTAIIRSSHQQEEPSMQTTGINIQFNPLDKADQIKKGIIDSLKKKGIHRYWNVETYQEYEFTKNIIQELQSQKNLFMLIAIIIMVVACSNIISMLIILVNDKKREIGILRSMGASSKNIGLIFGIAGTLIGVVGSMLGIAGAILTLRHLDLLFALLSRWQGHEMFNIQLYGQVIPQELSIEALSFVIIITVSISLFAGLIPAIKASLLRPSQVLRSGG